MNHVETLIIGAGPAGLQLSYFLKRRGREHVILERSEKAGGFFEHYPRHRKLLSINKVYTGCPDLESQLRYDWNSLLSHDEALRFSRYTRDYFPDADVLVKYLNHYARRLALPVIYNAEVQSVRQQVEGFEVDLVDGNTWSCHRLVVATGLFVPNSPMIEGLNLCEQYRDFSIAPEDFVDQRVLIVGKGNSAFETATNLIETTRKIQMCGAKTVRLAWATHFVGDLRAVNNNFLDTYQLKAQNNLLDGALVGVRNYGQELLAEIYFEARQRSYEFPCDRVLLCTGFKFDTSIFAEDAQPDVCMGGKLPAMSAEWESTNISGLFFAGTLMQSRDYKKTMSSFIHGFRHNIEALDIIMEKKRSGGEWAKKERLSVDIDSISRRMIDRISTSSAMLLQPGFLGDVMAVSESGSRIMLLHDVPVAYAMEHLAKAYEAFYVVTLEYKHLEGPHDVFAMPRGMGVEEDFYLHPIVRRYQGGELTGRFFLPDDLDNDWRNEKDYQTRLAKFLAQDLRRVEAA